MKNYMTSKLSTVLLALSLMGAAIDGYQRQSMPSIGSPSTTCTTTRTLYGEEQKEAKQQRGRERREAEQAAVETARAATCFKPEDRQHLLGIIEGAFGDFSSFNAQVRSLFKKRSTSSTQLLNMTDSVTV